MLFRSAIKVELIIVDPKYIYVTTSPIEKLQKHHNFSALQQLKIIAGKLPRILYTDFDPKLILDKVWDWPFLQQQCHPSCPNDTTTSKQISRVDMADTFRNGTSVYQ